MGRHYDFYYDKDDVFDNQDEYDDYEDELIDNEEDDYQNTTNYEKIKPKEDSTSDWQLYGLNKSYKNDSFSLTKANYLIKEEKIESNKEAIRYATYFAKNKNNDAKNFIINIINSDNEFPNVISDMAKTAFWLIFRNYVRVEVEKFYDKQSISLLEKSQRIGDAIQQCFIYIFSNLKRYDSEKGRISTFFSSKVLRGSILEYEAQRKGRASKHTMRVDKATVNAIDELEKQGINANSAIIARLINKSVNEVQISKARIHAENTMSNYDSTLINKEGIWGKSTDFDSPEKKYINNENKMEIVKSLEILSNDEREYLLASLGICYKDGVLEETNPLKPYEIEKSTGVDKNKIQQIINIAIKKLQKHYKIKSNTNNELLSGKGLLFNDDAIDKSLYDIIDIRDK